MSRYAYLTCKECEVVLWLGKAVFCDRRIRRFHIGQAGDPPNSDNRQMNRALWKFLADHASHNIGVIVEGDPDFEVAIDRYTDIGGDEIGSIPLDDYLKDWDG